MAWWQAKMAGEDGGFSLPVIRPSTSYSVETTKGRTKPTMTIQTFPFRLAIALFSCTLPLLATAQLQAPAVSAGESLPTGMSITPTAAKGSTLQPLNPDLSDRPDFTADHPI